MAPGQGPGVAELPPGPLEGAPDEGAPAVELEASPTWEQATIEQLLTGTGEGLHYMLGAGHEQAWKMTQADLDRIAPPLTRICNRYEGLLRFAPMADPLLVAHGVTLYGWRSMLQRERAMRDRREAELEVHGAGDGYVWGAGAGDEGGEPDAGGEPPEPGPGAPSSNGAGAVLEGLEAPTYFDRRRAA